MPYIFVNKLFANLLSIISIYSKNCYIKLFSNTKKKYQTLQKINLKKSIQKILNKELNSLQL